MRHWRGLKRWQTTTICPAKPCNCFVSAMSSGCDCYPGRNGGLEPARLSKDLRLDLIDVERRFLYQLPRDGKLTDESRRRIEREPDLGEESIAYCNEGEAPLPEEKWVDFGPIGSHADKIEIKETGN